jgi:lipoprotein-releasing system ATP-binding protein
MTAILEAHGLEKVYRGGDGSVLTILHGLDLTVEPGEFVAIVGASGSGKSTLLHLLGALDAPTAGTVAIDGTDLTRPSVEALAELRNRRIGFVFQFHHLLRDFTAIENVMMPLLIAGRPDLEARERALVVLESLGLKERIGHYPAQLSGGEQQRVAVARAVAPGPAVVLADEPSGNLDTGNAGVLHDLLGSLRERFGAALVVATHNLDLAQRADRILRLEGGRLAPVADSGIAPAGVAP